MTQPENDFDDFESGGASELFDPRSHQDHLLIVKLWDEVSPVVTEFCPTGYVTRNGKEWPNNALRASIVDLDMDADDGSRGRVYPGAMILTGLLIKELKRSVGKTLLLVWRQKDPSDKSSPYSVWEMKNDAQAVEVGRNWLNAHPEFRQIPAPPPWTNTPRSEPPDNGYRRDSRPDDRGYRDDRRDAPPRYDDRRARDYGQHDDRRGYDRDPWSDVDDARRRAEASRRDNRDGSFMSRSAESGRRGYQNEEPPF
jgi:hypothetical protein